MTKSLFAPEADFLSREQAKALSDRILSFAKADETRVGITSDALRAKLPDPERLQVLERDLGYVLFRSGGARAE